MHRLLFTLTFVLCWQTNYAQVPDSVKAYQYFNLFIEYEYQDSLKAAIYIDSGMYFAESSGKKNLIGSGYQYKGWHYQDQSKFRDAIKSFEKALLYFQEANNSQGVADAYGNLGNGYSDIDDIRKSLDYQMLSLKENDKILALKPVGDRLARAAEGRSFALHNIAGIFLEIGLNEKALVYEKMSIENDLKSKNYDGVAISYNSMARIYEKLGNHKKAVSFFNKVLDLHEEYPNDYNKSSTLYQFAKMDSSGISFDKRSEMILEAIDLKRKIGDKSGEASILLNWSLLNFNDFSLDSLKNVVKTVEGYLDEFDLDSNEEDYYFLLSKVYARSKDFAKAYEAVDKYLLARKESNRKQHTNDLVASEVNYQWEQKSYNDSITNLLEQEQSEANNEIEVQRLEKIIWISVLGLILFAISLYYFIRSNRKGKRLNDIFTQKNKLINDQKIVLEETNKSMSDSINYAERLQLAILPKPSIVNTYLPVSFLIFLPRDVVSGDFYWFEKVNDQLFLAVADCTGHGVPGAMVSVVCSNALNRALIEFNMTEPADILTKSRELVIDTFTKSGDGVDDGMDISLIRYDKKTKKVVFGGANNNLWVLRNSDSECQYENVKVTYENDWQLIELKGDRMPIGNYPNQKDFSQKSITLIEGDIVYQMSDGFIDQFGGADGKKYKSLKLKKKLLEIGKVPLPDQKQLLIEELNDWKGEHEQVDDICITAFQV